VELKERLALKVRTIGSSQQITEKGFRIYKRISITITLREQARKGVGPAISHYPGGEVSDYGKGYRGN